MPEEPGDPSQVRALFLEAIELPPALRSSVLNRDGLTDDTRQELRALLEADAGSETFLDKTLDADRLLVGGIGQRFGPYETTALLGRGGMGTVFRASRIDGELQQTVAVKVVEHGWLSPRALERFRQERQILAGLVHPNIARLIDGGTRPDGVPYLVMEQVEGLPLDRYCEAHTLSTAQRLRLFLPLCDAVGYAHQKLIVHRDLKPSNVLVTSEGEPKLLDFGIAKMLDAGSDTASQTLVLTPEFASPEQARGEEITTATDVYGLGAVLYHLLTGHPPHETAGKSNADMQHRICEPPTRPSTQRPELKGDLENILLKALHTEPRRRYHTPGELKDDIENWLAHRPVRATPDHWTYRLKRLVRRNTLATAAVALAVVATISGTAVSLYQAHRAHVRFAQVRDLANRFIFDFEASIRDTPGTLEARRKVAATGREYLDNLAADAGHDPILLRELAESYYRLGQVEASAHEIDLWFAHIQKSAAILKDLKDDCCGAPAQRALYLKDLNDLVNYWVDISPGKAVPPAEEGFRLAKDFYSKYLNEPSAARAMVGAQFMLGVAQVDVGQTPSSRMNLEAAVQRADALLQVSPDDIELAAVRADAGNRLAGVLSILGALREARDAEAKSVEVLDRLISTHPERVTWRNLRIRMAAATAGIIRRLAESDPSLKPQIMPALRLASTMARENVARNPGDNAAYDLAFVMTARLATQLARDKALKESQRVWQDATAMLDTLGRRDPSSHRLLYLRANAWLNQGSNLLDLHDWTGASAAFDKSEEFANQILRKTADDWATMDFLVGSLAGHSVALRHLGDSEGARSRCRLAMKDAVTLFSVRKNDRMPVFDIDRLRSECRILGVPDLTRAAAQSK